MFGFRFGDWSRQFSIYCERTDFGFWAEPVNALTNLAFLIAAAAILREMRRGGRIDWPVAGLAALTVVIGLGSFLFHTFATRWALYADLLPIAAFIIAYFVLALRRLLGLGLIGTALGLALFWLLHDQLREVLPRWAHGVSTTYATPLVALPIVALILLVRGRPGGGALFAAAALFALSLFFRIADREVCAAAPIGTHFLWHVLNGLVLYILMRAALRAGPARATDR